MKTMLKTLIIQFVVVIVALEIVGIWQKSNSYYWGYRYLFYSPNAVRDLVDGLWTYNPNTEIRSIASYSLPPKGAWIEYDCKFKTNKFGLINTNYTNQDEVDLLVLGDSFTEGQGGCPWLTEESISKDNSLRGKVILNGGLMGTGVLAFEKLTDWLESQIKIKNIIVIAISNDFKRKLPPENFWSKDQKCLNNYECDNTNYWWGLIPDASKEEILQKTAIRSKLRNNPDSWGDSLEYFSMTYRSVSALKKIFSSKMDSPEKNTNNTEYEDSLKALIRLRSKYPEMKLLLVEQRDEVGILGRENLDTKAVLEMLSFHKIAYDLCSLGIGDYMPIDGHPNPDGYKKLRNCLLNAVN